MSHKHTESETVKALELVFSICENYPATGHGLPTSDARATAALDALEEIGGFFEGSLSQAGWKTEVSVGVGAFPRIPWIVFCPNGLRAPKDGEFLCLVFAENGKGLVAGAMSATALKGKWKERLQPVQKDWGLPISGSKPNTKYSDAFFNPKPFYRNRFEISEIVDHLKLSLKLLKKIQKKDIDYLKNDTIESMKCGRQLKGSILTKPFAILTGGSGTGKTKLAESIALHFRNAESPDAANNSAIIPVGADWTDNRNVLGFVNHLREKDGKPVYQTTPILDLILEANLNTLLPHFLILDEMNLSHVERYFADFLSVMEQKDGGIRLHSEGGSLPKNGEGEGVVPEWIPFPQNLFVIGTVNVDETTYMFSPKVLDRANVIEFKVESKEIESFLENPHEYPELEKAPDGVAEEFLQLALDARAGKLDPCGGTAATEVPKHLVALFDILERGRFEFAYRTANEVVRYLRVCRHLAADKTAWDSEGWKSDLDAQIIQKLLPKLHGSIGRIARLLAELAVYCHAGENKSEDEKDTSTSPGLADAIELDEQIAAFPKSFKKLKSMMETLRDEQFVSFIQ